MPYSLLPSVTAFKMIGYIVPLNKITVQTNQDDHSSPKIRIFVA
jgi:hypothetical protein